MVRSITVHNNYVIIKAQTTPNQGIFAGTRYINFPGKNLKHTKPERCPLYNTFFYYLQNFGVVRRTHNLTSDLS